MSNLLSKRGWFDFGTYFQLLETDLPKSCASTFGRRRGKALRGYDDVVVFCREILNGKINQVSAKQGFPVASEALFLRGGDGILSLSQSTALALVLSNHCRAVFGFLLRLFG